MVENIHDRRAAIKDAVITLASLEKSNSRKRILIKRRLTARQQVRNIYEKSRCCKPGLFESKKKYTESIMKNKKKESKMNLKSVKTNKSNRSSKITKNTINGTCTVQHKKSNMSKVGLTKNTTQNKRQSGPKKKVNQGKRNVKEVKIKIQVKDTKKKIYSTKKILIKKEKVKHNKKKTCEKTFVKLKNKNVENRIRHNSNNKNINKDNSLYKQEAECDGLEIIKVIVDVHRIETEKDVLRIDINCDNKYSKETQVINCPQENKTKSFYEKNKLEYKLKDKVKEVNKNSYTCIYDSIKRKERKASRLAINNQSTENKSQNPLKRKLTMSDTNENKPRKRDIKKPKLNKYMLKKS